MRRVISRGVVIMDSQETPAGAGTERLNNGPAGCRDDKNAVRSHQCFVSLACWVWC